MNRGEVNPISGGEIQSRFAIASRAHSGYGVRTDSLPEIHSDLYQTRNELRASGIGQTRDFPKSESGIHIIVNLGLGERYLKMHPSGMGEVLIHGKDGTEHNDISGEQSYDNFWANIPDSLVHPGDRHHVLIARERLETGVTEQLAS